PEDDAADGAPREVVGRQRAATVPLEHSADARPEGDGAGQSNEPADSVHDRRAREVAEDSAARQAVEPPHGVTEPAARTPDPVAQYKSPHRQVSNTHSSRTFTVSRERANPASRPMNPACMKNTRNAVTSTQTVLIGLTKSFALWAIGAALCAHAALSKSQANAFMAPRTPTMPNILPPRMTAISRRVSFSSLSRRSFCLMPATVKKPCF